MPLYAWQGIDQSGSKAKGSFFANNPEELKESLLQKNIALLSYKETTQKRFSWPSHKPSAKHIATFFQHVSLLIGHGVELTQALSIAGHITAHPTIESITTHIIHEISHGKTCAEALEQYPDIFGSFIVNLIAAGENTGKLDLSFQHIAQHLEHQQMLRSRLRQAALAPLITLLFACLLVTGIIIFILPQFQTLYTTLGKPLPKTTAYLIAARDLLASGYGLIALLGLIGFFVLCALALKTPRVKKIVNNLTIRIPGISSLVIYNNIIPFWHTVSLFLGTGLSLTQALRQAQSLTNHSLLHSNISAIFLDIVEGKTLHESLLALNSPFFDAQSCALVHVGEQSGTLAPVLQSLCNHLNEKHLSHIHTITTVLTPLMMMAVGLFIGILMVILYQPIFNMGSLFQV